MHMIFIYFLCEVQMGSVMVVVRVVVVVIRTVVVMMRTVVMVGVGSMILLR